jgi:photosystem II stability/assembly factor-like uncharacterized protein
MLALVFLACLACSVAGVGATTWRTLGPYGGSIQAIAIDPSHPDTLYGAATSVGLFRSDDGGATWARTGLTMDSLPGAIVVDPKDSARVYVASSSGFFASVDGAATWAPSNNGLRTTYATTLVIDPADSKKLYLGGWGGVAKTTDRGATWADASTGLPEEVFVTGLVIEPITSSTLYAATQQGVWKSTDAGASWICSSTGLAELTIRALAIDRLNRRILYAATDTQGVWRTEDAGEHWQPAWSDSSAMPFRLAVDPRTSGCVVATTQGGDVLRTFDRGATWTEWSEGLPESEAPYSLAIRPDTGEVCLGLFARGVFRRAPGDAQWEEANAGLTGYAMSDLLVDAAGTRVYAGVSTYGPSFFQSGDQGTHWRMTRRGMYYPPVHALLQDPLAPTTLLSGNSGSIFRSTDGGETWAPSDEGLPRGRLTIYALLNDPADARAVCAGTSEGVWFSRDGGATWGNQRITDRTVRCLAWVEAPTLRLLAGTDAGVYVSLNRGEIWSVLGTGFPSGVAVRDVAAASGSLFAACGAAGLYRSDDHGKSWQPISVSASAPGVYGLLAMSQGSYALIAGTDGGVFGLGRSSGTWSSLAPGIPAAARLDTLAYDASHGILYAGGLGGAYALTLP